MYDHNSSVYNNNCRRAPRPPSSKSYETSARFDQKFLHELHNEVTKNLQEKMKSNNIPGVSSSSSELKTFLDFVESIPEYDDINHLSNKEFYKKLDTLKVKQKEFCELLDRQLKFETKDTNWIDDYGNLNRSEKGIKKKPALKSFCTTPVSKTTPKSDDDTFSSKPPSRRSVRIETPNSEKSIFTPEPDFRCKSRMRDFVIEDLNLEGSAETPVPLETKSAPNSPVRTRKVEYDGITIPKPFQMTVRDEENKIVEELFLKINKPKEEKQPQFKAHEVPVESQIPLFDKIMDEQHQRSQRTKEKRKAEIRAQMQPFSFTRRDEEIQELTRAFSKSLPCVYNDDVPVKLKKFRAKPVPKNLFSNYIYRKMHEDEFYRTLQKKIRAEEMLKHASLPPSMAKRERSKPKIDVCPRSYKCEGSRASSPVKKNKKIPNYKAYHEKYERELEELKNEFISTSPRPFKLKSSKKEKRGRKISSATSSDTRTQSSLDMSSLNRSNLAAILRIQSARKRLEIEMARRLEEAKLKEEARWREKLMRKKPVWQALAYSHEEDLAMRLQLRRDEERLRNEEHRLRMELMLGRVNQQPTLFERQSQMKFPRTKEELVDHLHQEYTALLSGTSKKRLRPKSATSDFSLIEMKDEAIQAEQESSNGKESESSSSEDKEECRCLLEESS